MGFYKSCSELPLKVFCEIVNTGDLSLLGNGSDQELNEAWDSIFDEWVDGSKSMETQNLVAKRRKLLGYLAEYELIKILLHRVAISPDKEIIDKLKTLRHEIDPENLKESVLNGFRRAKILQSKAMSLQIELEKNQSEHVKMNFDQMMAILHKNHFSVSEDITASRYLECIKLIK